MTGKPVRAFALLVGARTLILKLKKEKKYGINSNFCSESPSA